LIAGDPVSALPEVTANDWRRTRLVRDDHAGTYLKDEALMTTDIPEALATVGSLDERPDADLLTLVEVAAILRVPVNTLRWWRQQGAGPAFFKLGRRLVTTVGELRTWVTRQQHGGGPDAA
jgi:hypothetical protein